MTSGQKIIKYFAIALGVGIIISIVSGILGFIGIITYHNDDYLQEMKEISSTTNDVKRLEIDIDASELIVEVGDKLGVSTNNKYIKVKERNNELKIEERKHSTIFGNNESQVILTIPTNYIFDYVSLDTGVGLVNISDLATKELDLDLGMGEITITNLNVYNKAEVDGGAGKINISGNEINNLKLDIGMGETIINGKILGNSEIECGTGRLELNIPDIKENYTLYLSKGIGTINIDDESVSNGVIGNGINRVNIDGGIGEIDVNFLN